MAQVFQAGLHSAITMTICSGGPFPVSYRIFWFHFLSSWGPPRGSCSWFISPFHGMWKHYSELENKQWLWRKEGHTACWRAQWEGNWCSSFLVFCKAHTYSASLQLTSLHFFTNWRSVAILHEASLSAPFFQRYLLTACRCHILASFSIFQIFHYYIRYSDLWSVLMTLKAQMMDSLF